MSREFIDNMMYPLTRLRRNRKASWVRNLLSENTVSVHDFILPIFIQEHSAENDPIDSMPGVYRHTISSAVELTKEAYNLGIQAVALFPCVPSELKDPLGQEALNADNLLCRATQRIKQDVPNMGLICDVALDPYTNHGHDGLINENGDVLNDETIEILKIQALNLSTSGCDVVAPSDMMDGRVGVIREYLDNHNQSNISICSYCAKYASAFYGPFRDAVGSGNQLGKKNKLTYQMSPANTKEALKEAYLDINEGADMLIIKPGLPYLDIVKNISDNVNAPLISYHVSGEYSMLKIAANSGIVDYNKALLETMLSFKRAGCSAIITYAALDAAKLVSQ